MRLSITLFSLVTLCLFDTTVIETVVDSTTVRLRSAELERTVERAARLMDRNYVFVDLGKQSAQFLKERLAKGAYDGIETRAGLASALTADLRLSCRGDLHLRVRVAPDGEGPINGAARRSAHSLDEAKRMSITGDQHGFERVELLEGNVGYIKMSYFDRAERGGRVARSAMKFVADADALVIDVRANNGGSVTMVALLAAYFFEERVLLETTWFRSRQRHEKIFSDRKVSGKRVPELPLFIVQDERTISAGEMLAYCLQAKERAVIVGTTSAGAANSAGDYKLDKHFIMTVPTGTGTNPITGTNWEGTGVIPDVVASSRKAAAVAYLLALEGCLEREGDPIRRAQLREIIAGIDVERAR